MLRTITCGELRDSHAGTTVTLAGWVDRRRDHGSLIFIDLRDREGVTQVVFNPEVESEAHATAETLRSEWVVQVVGQVIRRPGGTDKAPDGEIDDPLGSDLDYFREIYGIIKQSVDGLFDALFGAR